jgi:tetratricopeptide (TPR) repeat protein
MGRVDFVRGLLLLCIVLLSTPGISRVTNNSEASVSGTLFADGTNQRLVHAIVVLSDEAGSSLQQATTNESGEFTFQGLRSGHYVLRIEAAGFQLAEVHVDLSFTSLRGLAIVLKPNPTAAAPSAAAGSTISTHELSMPQDARELFASGKKKLYVDKNAKAALSDFQSATSKAPAYYEAYFQAGVAYLSEQNPAEAEKLFRKAVDMSEKKCGDADIALGALLLEHHQLSEGESLLRLGLASNPLSWSGQFELGKLELSRDHPAVALAAAETAKSLAPRQAVVYRLLAAIHLRQQNYPALIADIDSYLQLDSDSPTAARAKELRAEAQRQLATSPATAAVVK